MRVRNAAEISREAAARAQAAAQDNATRLVSVDQALLDVRPIDWSALTRRFMNPGELEALIALVRMTAPRAMLEIGVNGGRTAKAMLDNVAGLTRYVGIDVLPGYVTSKTVQRRELPERPGEMVRNDRRFELVLRARGSLDLNAAELGQFDAVFIDGDHGREAVLHDTALARAVLRRGGIIIWHDYNDVRDRSGNAVVDVRAVLEQLAAAGAPIRHVAGTWLAFERV